MDLRAIRARLTRWYGRYKRDLPWRRTRDPYAIWISEVMLQQTRVAAVVPYYLRFLARFPDAKSLADAPEADLLMIWSGLGYYSRARNLQRAAREIEERGQFPNEYEQLLGLAGVGPYTAAAIASMAFELPHAVVDGNVRRVLSRLANDGNTDAQKLADQLLDRRHPARWNQAVMELGAMICLPRNPQCESCPLALNCGARHAGTQHELPPKRTKRAAERLERTLLIIRSEESLILVPSPRVKGFWDLPEPFPGARLGAVIGEFRHSITHTRYRFIVREVTVKRKMPKAAQRTKLSQLDHTPLSTIARKALGIYEAK